MKNSMWAYKHGSGFQLMPVTKECPYMSATMTSTGVLVVRSAINKDQSFEYLPVLDKYGNKKKNNYKKFPKDPVSYEVERVLLKFPAEYHIADTGDQLDFLKSVVINKDFPFEEILIAISEDNLSKEEQNTSQEEPESSE